MSYFCFHQRPALPRRAFVPPATRSRCPGHVCVEVWRVHIDVHQRRILALLRSFAPLQRALHTRPPPSWSASSGHGHKVKEQRRKDDQGVSFDPLTRMRMSKSMTFWINWRPPIASRSSQPSNGSPSRPSSLAPPASSPKPTRDESLLVC